jgi:signal transduction histidine kinase
MRVPFLGRRRPRAAVITGLLVLALGFAVVLALQAFGAAQYQKAQAERVLRDYSAFAAARFASRSAYNLWYFGFVPAIKTIDRAKGRLGYTPDPARLATPDDTFPAAFFRQIRYSYELDTATRRLTFGGPAPSPAWRRWLTDTIAATLHRSPPMMGEVAAVLGGPPGETHAITVFTLPRAAARAQHRVLGYVTGVDALTPYFQYVDSSGPLLPRALTGGVTVDSIGSVVVRDARGVPVYRSAIQYASTITGRDTLGSSVADLRVDVALRPEIAGRLVIGGLPRSRLPLLVALFALTAGLIVVALIQLRREYELASLRTDFVTGVSHELRTPLAQIRMFAETLMLGRVRSPDERQRSLAVIDQEARRLTHLVENLLHFSRSERRSLRVAPIPIVLGPAIRAVLDSFSPLAETRQVRLVTHLTEGAVARVDEGALRQMLLNLLDNAVKYGPAGQTVTVGTDPPASDCVRLWVQDQGPGVPAADRERIWDQFWRLERDRGSAVAGTGIGLSVVRELAVLHGGRVWVEVAPGGGARFVIELPSAALSPQPVAAGPATPQTASAQVDA